MGAFSAGRRRIWLGLGGAVALVAVAGLMAPAGAAQVSTSAVAPYAAADHSTYMSCAPHQLAPSCAATAFADRALGVLDVSAASDSGAGGNLPGAVISQATAQVAPTIAIGRATAATFRVHLRVTKLATAAGGLGRSYVVLLAGASCAGCPEAAQPYVYLSDVGDQTLTVTLVRGGAGGGVATVSAVATASTAVGCDDFCLMPTGTARSLARVVVTGVDVKLWGLGQPTVPIFSEPAAGTTVAPETYQTACDTSCQTFTGEHIAGAAEPGMPVEVRDGERTVTTVITDDRGRWTADLRLAPGPHAMTAVAAGPAGTARSVLRDFTVTG